MPGSFPIQALLFDLDGTLVDRQSGAKKWLASQYAKFPAPRGDFAEFYAHFQQLDARGYASKLETFGALAPSWGWNQAPDAIWAAYRRDVGHFCELFPDAAPTLRLFREKGLGLAILTNGTIECQQGKIEALKLDEMVDATLISEREGYKKPAPELFWRACEKLGQKPGNCLMIGDSFQTDVEGAWNAGLTAVFLERDMANDSTTDLPKIRSLWELAPFLALNKALK